MMDRDTIKSFTSRVMDNDRMRSFAERAGLYTPPSTTGALGREVALLAAGVGVGALIMYMLDPEQGRRRRALARDQVTSFANTAEKQIEAKARHYSNKARGVMNKMRGSASDTIDATREADQPF
jgi:hypothetical protein